MNEKPSLFVLDDEQIFLDQVKTSLENEKLDVKLFLNPKELFQALKHTDKSPIAILLDFTLTPDYPGSRVLKQIQKDHKHIPVIVCTGQDRQRAVFSYSTGPYAVIMKPLDSNELKVILHELLERNELLQKMADDALELATGFDCSMVWQLDQKRHAYKIVAWKGDLDRDYHRKVKLSYDELPWLAPSDKDHHKRQTFYRADVQDPNVTPHYVHRKEAIKRNWFSLLTIPLVKSGRVLGWIDCYAHVTDVLAQDEERKKLLETLNRYALQASAALYSDMLTRQLRIIQEITQQLSWASTEAKVFKTILEKALDYLGCNFAWIHKYNFLEGKLEPGAYLAIDSMEQCPYNDATQIDPTAFQALLQKGAIQRERYTSLPPATILQAPYRIQSAVYIPIKRADKHVVGILTLASIREDFFTLDDLQFLQSLAATAAVVIDQVKSTQHLKEINRLAQENVPEKELTTYLVKAARDLTHADVVFWELSTKPGEGDKVLRIGPWAGSFDSTFIKHSTVPNDPARSSCAKALATGQPVTIENIKQLNSGEVFYHELEIEEFEWNSFVAIPLLSKSGLPLGVLALYGKNINDFSEVGRQLIENFAFQTALALQERRHIVALQELSKIGQQLTGNLTDSRQLLQSVVDLGRSLGQADLTVLYPFDHRNVEKFNKSAVTHAGNLNRKNLKIAEKPKDDGVANMTLKYGMLVVEDVVEREGAIAVGFDPPQRLEPTSGDFELIRRSIAKSRFLQQEKVSSFVAIALRAADVDPRYNKPDVGVLYFNYRASRDFDPELLRVLDIFARQIANIIYRNRLLEDIQKQNTLMNTVNQRSLRIHEERDAERQLKEIIQAGIDMLNAKGGKIYRLVNGRRQDAHLVAGVNLPRGVKKGMIISADSGLVGKVIKERKSVVENNYAAYEYRHPPFAHLFSAVVEAPLMIRGEVIGVLSIFADRNERQFTEEEDAVALEILASQASAALYNRDLNAELEQSYQAGLNLSTEDGLFDLADAILIELAKVIDFDRATIQTFSSPSNPRHIMAYTGFARKNIRKDLLKPVQDDPLIWEMFQNKSPLVLPDTHSEPKWSRDIPEIKEIRSWACIPLIDRGEVFGLITLDHYQAGQYQARDLERLQRFSPQASVALRKVLLLGQIRYQKEDYENINVEITKGIADSDGADQIYQRVNEAAFRMFSGVHLAEIYLLAEGGRTVKRVARQIDKSKAKLAPSVELNVEKGMLGRVLASRAPLWVEDAKIFPDFQYVVKNTRSAIIAPIKQQGTIIGLLSIEHPEVGGLEETDTRIAEALCNLVAITKEKGDLLRQLSLMKTFLNAVQEVEALKVADGVDAIFAILTRAVLRINPDVTWGCRFFLEDVKLFDLDAVRKAIKQHTIHLNITPLKLGVGYIGQVYQAGQATLMNHRGEMQDGKLGRRVQSMAIAPLWSGGRTIGLLALEGKQEAAFNEFELSVLKSLTLLSENKIHQFDQYRKQQEALKIRFNPYLVGGAIEDPDLFFGRAKIAQEILSGIHRNHYFIKGMRRIGKSSLLRHLIQRLRQQPESKYQFHTVLYDLQNIGVGDFFLHFMRRIIRDLDLIDVIPLPELEQTFGHFEFQDQLDLVFEHLDKKTPGKTIQVVAFIDEIQKLDHLEPEVPERLRAILIREDRLKVVMTGYQFFTQLPSTVSPFNIHLTKDLGPLEEDEARQLIIDPVQSIYSYESAAIELILKASKLEPRNIQFLCHEAINRMYELGKQEKTPMIRIQHVEASLPALLKLLETKQ